MQKVEKIGQQKKRWLREEADEDGIDLDTYEANYVPEFEDDEELKPMRGRGGRGMNRGGRGGYQNDRRGGYS
jgi:hypothetical protein